MNKYFYLKPIKQIKLCKISLKLTKFKMDEDGFRRDYQTKLTACCIDQSTCLYGLFCPTCLAAQNWADLNEESCSIYHIMCSFNPFWTRQYLKQQVGMEYNFAADCCVFLCCCPCAICQDAREIKSISAK